MYDADYDAYLNDMHQELESSGYFTKDSGTRAEHPDGVIRDTDEGKPRFDLLFPKGIPFNDQLITRTAELYERGGVKYGMRNWEKSDTPETLEHHEAALMRHVVRFLTGTNDGEDHAAAIVWNVNAVDLCRRKISLKEIREVINTVNKVVEEQDTFSAYTFPYIGKDTASTGNFYQKEIRAGSYSEAKRKFDNWLSGQPFYNSIPEAALPEAAFPSDLTDAELEWSEGDVLEEVSNSLDGTPYRWAYQPYSDIWIYQPKDSDPSPDSARSSRKLFAEFGPLKCIKGSHAGRVVNGS